MSFSQREEWEVRYGGSEGRWRWRTRDREKFFSHIGSRLEYLRFVCPLVFFSFPLSKHINTDSFSFHFIFGAGRSWSEHTNRARFNTSCRSVKQTAASLFKLPDFYLLPLFSASSLFLPSVLPSFHLLRPSCGCTFSLITATPVCEILTKSCPITYLIYAAAHNLTAHRSVIMCLKYNRQQRLFWPPANGARV